MTDSSLFSYGTVTVCGILLVIMALRHKKPLLLPLLTFLCLYITVAFGWLYAQILVPLASRIPMQVLAIMFGISAFLISLPLIILGVAIRHKAGTPLDVEHETPGIPWKQTVFLLGVALLALGAMEFLESDQLPSSGEIDNTSYSAGLVIVATIRILGDMGSIGWVGAGYLLLLIGNSLFILVFWHVIFERAMFTITHIRLERIALAGTIAPTFFYNCTMTTPEAITRWIVAAIYVGICVGLYSFRPKSKAIIRVMIILPSIIALVWTMINVQSMPYHEVVRIVFPK